MRRTFSPEEIRDIVFVYGFCAGNASEAERVYRAWYPGRIHPNRRAIQRIYHILPDMLGITRQRYERSSTSSDANLEEIIMNIVRQNPSISTRRIALRLNTSQNRIWRIFHRNLLHPYHFTPVHNLLPGDQIHRLNFASIMLQHQTNRRNFLGAILWTDEAQFTRDGICNLHNLHHWSRENPRVMRTRSFQHRFSINVWAGIIGRVLIGPFFLPDRITGESYLHFLEERKDDIIDEIPVRERAGRGIIFQHDGAPPHNSAQVRRWLSEHFRTWIGRGGDISWPARSPDLTPLDFYLWGHMKDIVYAAEIHSEAELREKILQAADQIRESLIGINMEEELKRRFELCIQRNGGHIENILT